ncbi:Fur family transcriptional regulator [Caulobacter sp. D4A]|uniref:Fur family transcriptional regulator n=1 Tax=unclassified Caulobacter TaxID=2648921 RepID=UPI000D7280E0|nr:MULTISPECIES: Fur family transcriptional regulator [unclassified Caulobacter]PXA87811.1 Fur family transcriptional regulator [Caulobacter sp. D5]PXA91222.1 Fur family transcriptional regulator [Caulobacter sp. D4A]
MAHNACDHDHHHHGVAGDALASELAAAEARCQASDQRLTAPRRRVLELLLEAGQPVKAYDLISSFAVDGPPAKPPTVYRALEFLEKQGFAHRIESLNSYVACRREADGHAAAFLICDCCGATREFEPAATADIIAAGSAAGYALTGVTIEAHGKCADCRE